jgi:hypothetical protein
MRFGSLLPPARRILVNLFVLFVLPHTLIAQGVIRGIVVDAESGRPVPEAFVELVDGVHRIASATTDTAGLFTLRAPRIRDAVLNVSRIGYASLRRPIRTNSMDESTLSIELTPEPVPLPTIGVTTESGVLDARLDGYLRRRKLGAGHFFSEQQLKNVRGAPLSDLLRIVPGIEVTTRRTPFGPLIFTNSNQIQNQVSPFRRRAVPNSQMQIGPCPMQLYIDGRHFSTQDLGVDVIKPEDLVAVEVFRSVAEVPAEFGGLHVRCGVISVWTRRVPGS